LDTMAITTGLLGLKPTITLSLDALRTSTGRRPASQSPIFASMGHTSYGTLDAADYCISTTSRLLSSKTQLCQSTSDGGKDLRQIFDVLSVVVIPRAT